MRALVRFSGEMATKSRRTRSRFQRRLVRNLRDGLRSRGLDAQVEVGWSRLFVDGPPEAADLLGRVFGISSHSPVIGECSSRLDDIVHTGRRLFAHRVHGRSYAVRARRSGRHDFGSRDVHERLGAALNPGATVDLDAPEVEVRVEIRDERAHFFSDRVPGPGGLPLGVQGRAIALLSGGFDSAVAAWMALRRGIELDYLFCNLGGAAYTRMVAEVGQALADGWSFGSRPRLHVVEFGEVVDAMRDAVKPAYLQVVLKRLMYGAASRVAAEVDAEAVVTGESVGQVSSQTLKNLRAIDDAADRPVLRPLLGFDKEEIMERARVIGTHDLSARVREYCQVAPDRPVTAGSPSRAAREAGRVDAALLRDALGSRAVLDLRALTPADLVAESLFLDHIPEEATVIDTRDEADYGAWHWPGAERRELDELARGFSSLDRERTYVLYCAEGLRTAHLAERMQAAGFEAYSVRGGARALRRRLAREGGAGR